MLYAARDQVELSVVDAVDQDCSGVRTLRRCPLSQDVGEVTDVVSHEDALLLGCECQYLLVIQPLECLLLVERPDVVSGVSQPAPDARSGYMCVKQEPHRCRLSSRRCALQEGI
jgi:hypothetical protein